MWILKNIPELEDPKKTQLTDQMRCDMTFKLESTSFQGAVLWKMMGEALRTSTDYHAILKHYSDNLCKLTNEQEDKLQRGCVNILKIDSFNAFFQAVGLKEYSSQEVAAMLQQAILNSKVKRYHGNVDEILKLPSAETQMRTLLQSQPRMADFSLETHAAVKQKENKSQQ